LICVSFRGKAAPVLNDWNIQSLISRFAVRKLSASDARNIPANDEQRAQAIKQMSARRRQMLNAISSERNPSALQRRPPPRAKRTADPTIPFKR
jgi:hypothetical protein